MTNPTYEITPDKFTYGGEVMGRLPDGRAVFVPFALPGEIIKIQLVEDKPRFARAELLEILKPTESRITPRCPHFSSCGGCHYQHLSYEDQCQIKSEILVDQLQRIGKFENPPIESIVPSPQPWNYRNFVQFHLGEDGKLGFLSPRSHQLIPITECHLPEESLNQIWPQMELEPNPDILRVGLRMGAEGEAILIMETASDEPLDFSVDFPIAAIQSGPESTHILSDGFSVDMRVKDFTFRVSGESFFQVNTLMAEVMIDHLLENLPLSPESIVLDVYCGVGLFSAFLAPKVEQLIGIESSPSAVEDFTINLDCFENVSIYQARAEQALPSLDVKADMVIVDPPRAGIAPKALDAIVEIAPDTIAYISCDPATLARDGKRLTKARYILEKITPFDLFPQTFHIESISFWKKAD